jgi:hypothetical protein
MWASWPARLATATGSTLRHSSIRNLTITGLAASGRRDRRTVRPWLLARPAPQWVGGGIDRGQADHLGGENLTQKPTSPNHQQPLTALESYNGRSAFAAGTALHAPIRLFPDRSPNGSVGWFSAGPLPSRRARKSDIRSMGRLGRTRTFGGLDDIFQLERAPRLHGGRSACSHDLKIMVWKTWACCATVRPK